ncbi:MAG TPA: DUF1800 domain-containing protein [Acidimicrobiia bacterium]|nr:DUF1800 domain-containing protein [Acidimicrobiia bacterium]
MDTETSLVVTGPEPDVAAIRATEPVAVPAEAAPPEEVDRRSLFRRPLTMALAALGGGALLAACDFTSAPFDRLVHLLERLTYGATPAERDHIVAIGEAAWLNEQFDPASLDTSAVDAKIAALPALSQSAVQLFTNYPDGQAQLAAAQLQLALGIRAAESPAQLFERMVEFWSDHFNVPLAERALQLLKIVEDREIIRPRALGTFKDLVVADALSPAMLLYLNNNESSVGAINENYGRELLELHTLGVDGGYTEADVVSTARLLTGWTINRNTGTFQFVLARHDTSPLTIMGWTRPSDTNYLAHGIQFLQWLAVQPQCAQHVCRKLAVRFVSDQPDQSLVDAMAATWLANNSAIEPVLRTMVAHPAFDASAHGKFHRPLDYHAFVLRALGAQTAPTTAQSQLVGLGKAFAGLGQLPFTWPHPNGFPDVEGAWLNTGAMLGRWNLAGDIVGGAFAPISYDVSPLRSSLVGKTATEIYNLVANQLVLENVTAVGQVFLNSQLGWTSSLRPSGAQIDTALPTILVSVLVAADAQHR